jgi:CheY-like chemotaxis protein
MPLESRHAPPSGHYVLVVEDNQDVRETLVELLESYGYDAIGAEHGREALDTLARLGSRPCMIVLDLMMPVMDGRTFRLEQLKQPEVSSVPVVIVSAYDETPERLREMQAAAYLRKPINLGELMRLVGRLC